MSETVGELESYLSQLQSEGQLQSLGRFTLDFAKALEKLGGQSRAQIHRWLFFAVQAAVGYGASEIKLSVSTRAVSVAFWLDPAPSELLDGAAFEVIEEKPDLKGTEAASQNLRQALLWGRALNPVSFVMMVEGDHPGYILTADDKGMNRRVAPPKGAGPTACALVLRPTPELLKEGMAWAGALQAEAIYRLSFCPVPVNLDGHWLSMGESTALIRDSRRRAGNVKLVERYLFDPDPQAPGLAVLHPRLQPASSYGVEGRVSVSRRRHWQPSPRLYHMELAAPGLQRRQWSVGAHSPFAEGGLELARWNADGVEKELWLDLGFPVELERFKNERVKVRALLTRLRVTGNYLIIACHGMLLDPIRFEGLPGSGWVAVVASNLINTDASAVVAIHDDRMEQLIQWVRAEVYALHARLAEKPPSLS